jgi:hypothetical protein
VKVRVPISGTVGKSVTFDPNAGARAEAAVAALAAQISAGVGANIRHSSLSGLQIGDDHPQYTGNQFPETITGQWNFQTIPFIQGETLAEYIEDVAGSGLVNFLQDTPSIKWTYFDTANELEANVDQGWAPVWTNTHTFRHSMLFDGSFAPSTPAAGYVALYAATNQGHTGLQITDQDGSVIRLARDLVVLVRNTSGSSIAKGQVVNFTGATGSVPNVALADADTFGLHAEGIMQETVANNGYGLMQVRGNLAGLNTSTLTEGAKIYLSSTAGAYTTTAPALPATLQELGTVVRQHATQGSIEIDVQTALGEGHGIPAGANPSASLGLTAVNGSAHTYMRSDGAPALDQGIVPTWTGLHSFGNDFYRDGAAGTTRNFGFRSAGSNRWIFRCTSTAESGGNAGSDFQWLSRTDAGGALLTVISVIRSSGNVLLENDNQELKLGASQDLRLYHDGTNSIIRNDTGFLNTQIGTTLITRQRTDVGAGMSIFGFLSFGSPLSPAQITANQNDYNPTGLDSTCFLRLSTDASRDITGLVTASLNGRWLTIYNVGTQNIVLKDESASSTAVYRFALKADITIAPDGGVMLQYDNTTQRWRCCATY